jgi:hypothetical protein
MVTLLIYIYQYTFAQSVEKAPGNYSSKLRGGGGAQRILLDTGVRLRFSKHPTTSIHIFNIFANHTHSYISVEHIFHNNVINVTVINAGDKWLYLSVSTAEDVNHGRPLSNN